MDVCLSCVPSAGNVNVDDVCKEIRFERLNALGLATMQTATIVSKINLRMDGYSLLLVISVSNNANASSELRSRANEILDFRTL